MFPTSGYAGLSPIPGYIPTRMGLGRANDIRDFRMHKALENQFGIGYTTNPEATVAWHGGWSRAGPAIGKNWQNQWMGMQNPASRAGVRGMYPGGYF
ncbi:hypothetical protein Slin14017_G128150 [Septoria linicola]|nr:hypothetical protein Slin14017_G128150 [Septoria linicola]